MAVDVEHERLLSFAELAASLPARRRGRPVHVSTVHRWRTRGLDGIRLEAVRVGGIWATSWEAFARFCDALSAVEDREAEIRAAPASTESRRRAAQELDDENW